MRTPSLDRLAARGLSFDRPYTVNPVCTPTRCSILTGQYPSRHGRFHVGTDMPEDYPPSVAADLAGAGYFTAIVGKSHFQAEFARRESVELKPHLFDFEFHRRWSGPHHGFELAQISVGHSSERAGCSRHHGVWLRDRGVPLDRYFGVHPYTHYGPWDLPERFHSSAWVAEEAIAAVDRARALDRRFFLWASFPDPHNPYVAPEPWASMYSPEEMADPVPPAPTGCNPPCYDALVNNGNFGDDPDLQCRNWSDCRPLPGRDSQATRQLRAVYHGMVSLMDRHIGRIFDHIEDSGALANTVIVFCSVHGDHLGDYGLWGKGLPAYDCVQRIPFIVFHPACRTPGRRSPALQSLVDLRSTFRQIAGLEAPAAGGRGIPQLASWLDASTSCRENARVEFRPSQGPYLQVTIVTGRHKLVLYRQRTYGELYDMVADPLQLQNLWTAARHRRLRDELAERLAGEVVGVEEEVVRERVAFA